MLQKFHMASLYFKEKLRNNGLKGSLSLLQNIDRTKQCPKRCCIRMVMKQSLEMKQKQPHPHPVMQALLLNLATDTIDLFMQESTIQSKLTTLPANAIDGEIMLI